MSRRCCFGDCFRYTQSDLSDLSDWTVDGDFSLSPSAPPSPTGLQVEVEVRFGSGSDEAGVVLWLDSDNSEAFKFGPNLGSAVHTLDAGIAGYPTPPAAFPQVCRTWETGRWYKVRICHSFGRGSSQVTVDGEAEINPTSPIAISSDSLLANGGIYTPTGSTEYRNFRLTERSDEKETINCPSCSAVRSVTTCSESEFAGETIVLDLSSMNLSSVHCGDLPTGKFPLTPHEFTNNAGISSGCRYGYCKELCTYTIEDEFGHPQGPFTETLYIFAGRADDFNCLIRGAPYVIGGQGTWFIGIYVLISGPGGHGVPGTIYYDSFVQSCPWNQFLTDGLSFFENGSSGLEWGDLNKFPPTSNSWDMVRPANAGDLSLPYLDGDYMVGTPPDATVTLYREGAASATVAEAACDNAECLPFWIFAGCCSPIVSGPEGAFPAETYYVPAQSCSPLVTGDTYRLTVLGETDEICASYYSSSDFSIGRPATLVSLQSSCTDCLTPCAACCEQYLDQLTITLPTITAANPTDCSNVANGWNATKGGRAYTIRFPTGSCSGTITKSIPFTYTAGDCGPGDSGLGTATLSVQIVDNGDGTFSLFVTLEVDGSVFTVTQVQYKKTLACFNCRSGDYTLNFDPDFGKVGDASEPLHVIFSGLNCESEELARPQSEAEARALAPGTRFIAPDGSLRYVPFALAV
jgi:hypothetical protein